MFLSVEESITSHYDQKLHITSLLKNCLTKRNRKPHPWRLAIFIALKLTWPFTSIKSTTTMIAWHLTVFSRLRPAEWPLGTDDGRNGERGTSRSRWATFQSILSVTCNCRVYRLEPVDCAWQVPTPGRVVARGFLQEVCRGRGLVSRPASG